MDRITTSLLEEFVSENNLEKLDQDKAFEHFCGYLVTAEHYSETFTSEDIAVGGGGDSGMDCIAIIVNGALVTEPEEIQDFADANGYLDVQFILVQAERSNSFDSAKIGQLQFGIQDFFASAPKLPQNENVKKMSRITNEIYNRSGLFRKGAPQCWIYYITTGKWVNDTHLAARKSAVIEDLKSLKIFSQIEFFCHGAEEIQKMYRNSKNAVSVQITFSDKVDFPEIEGVEQAYLGLLPAPEFLKLIQNTNEEILTSLFFDNVRDWQQWNQVNSEMKATLESSSKIYFPLLNNGVTIVAKRIISSAKKFQIEDYQVVNGCQTSYVLHETRSYLNEQVMVPVRLIATTNEDLKNSIIKATNSQTPVTEDQLFALSDFPKKLEAFFSTFEGRKKLYYERRSKQYSSTSIEKVRVINMTILVRSFAAFFLKQPHRTTRNYKALAKAIGTAIFHKEHCLEPYYVAAYAYYKLDYFFRNQSIGTDLKVARYHLLLGFRLLAAGADLPPLNSREAKRVSESVMEILWDDNRCLDLFIEVSKRIREMAADIIDRDTIHTEPFTQEFISKF